MSNQNNKPTRSEQLLQGKLNILSAILKLGHESFRCNSFNEWLSFVVNNSVLAFKYNRAAIIDLRNRKPSLIAMSGQGKINSNSELALQLVSVCKELPTLENVTVIDEEFCSKHDFHAKFYHELAEITANKRALIVAPLKITTNKLGAANSENDFLWVIEFNDINSAKAIANLVALLIQHYNESLNFVLNQKNFSLFKNITKPKSFFTPMRIAAMIIILFIISLVFVRLPLMSKAEFELIPSNENIQYAPLDGIISKSFFVNGQKVNKGDDVVKYETNERNFSLSKANAVLNEAKSRLNITYRESFIDPTKLPMLKILKLQVEQAKIAIARNKYYMERSIVKSNSSGIIAIDDAHKLEGKYVRAGQKLFETLNSEGIVAEILLDQKNASALKDLSSDKITLSLETMPELVIRGKLISKSPKPVLTEKNIHCYVIKVKLNELPPNVICGMRGNANIYGKKVSLGYFLFKNVVLWWRKSI